MPLPKHTVQPVKLSQVNVPDSVDNELEYVANVTVCNVMRQIASISRLANNMFEELTVDLSSLAERAIRLQNRVAKLHEDLQTMRNGDEDLTSGVQPVELPVFVSNKPADSQVLNRNTIPPSMRSRYEEAEPAPPLQQMDALRDDQKISIKLYSDPSFFFDLWSQEMLQDHKHRRGAKKKKAKNKSKPVLTKSVPNQGIQKSPLVIQQPGVGGHYVPANISSNGPLSNNHLVSVDNSLGKYSQLKSPLNINYGNTPLPPPPPPPSAFPNVLVENKTDLSVSPNPDQPNHHFLPATSANNYMNGVHDASIVQPSVSSNVSNLPINLPTHHPPPPPPMFVHNNEPKLSSLKSDSLLVDVEVNKMISIENSNFAVPNTIKETQAKLLQRASSGSPGAASFTSHELPPPPAPIFDNKSFGESIMSESFTGASDINNNRWTPIPPPPLAVFPAVSAPSPPIPPPPPPPPLDLVSNYGAGIENSPVQNIGVSKTGNTKLDIPQGPPQDLLLAIRAGFQLRKVADRKLPDSSKVGCNNNNNNTTTTSTTTTTNSNNNNNTNTLGNKPGDVQAIYEAVRRRRECMENNSSSDDDKERNSESSGWED